MGHTQFIHEFAIAHLDLKPSNVLFKDKNRQQIQIIDFGMAKAIPRLKKKTELVGTRLLLFYLCLCVYVCVCMCGWVDVKKKK